MAAVFPLVLCLLLKNAGLKPGLCSVRAERRAAIPFPEKRLRVV
jgi:hypothetical protein